MDAISRRQPPRSTRDHGPLPPGPNLSGRIGPEDGLERLVHQATLQPKVKSGIAHANNRAEADFSASDAFLP